MVKLRALTLTWTVLVLAVSFGRARADETELLKLYSPNPRVEGHFGGGLAMSEDRVIVAEGAYSNAAYIYRREANGWAYEATISPHDAEPYENFGSVAISGDVAVVGSPNRETSRGAAYIFRKVGATWSEEAMLVASDGIDWDYFGLNVAVDGDVAMVVSGEQSGARLGAAYVYRHGSGGWIEEAKLIGSKSQLYDGFGWAIALKGGVAVMGAPMASPGSGHMEGCAYVFRDDGTMWREEAWLVPSTGNDIARFGFTVAIDGDRLIAGAPWDSTPIQWAGAAFVFERQGGVWGETAKIQSLEPGIVDNFGWAVALDGDRAAISEIEYPDNQGSVSVFEHSGVSWSRTHKLLASDSDPLDYLGSALGLWKDDLVAGAMYDSDAKSWAGSVYFYCKMVPGVSWIDRGHATPGTNGPPLLQGQGDLQPGQPVTITLANARADSPMVLVIGDTNFELPIHGIILGPYPKFLLLGFRTDGSGNTTLGGDWPDGVPACYAFYFQAVITDPLGPDGLAASNILSVTTR